MWDRTRARAQCSRPCPPDFNSSLVAASPRRRPLLVSQANVCAQADKIDGHTHTPRCTSDTQRHRETDTKEMAWSHRDVELEGPRMALRSAAELPTRASLLIWLEGVGTVLAAVLSWLHKRWSWSKSVLSNGSRAVL